MAKTGLVFGTNEEFRALDHLLNHHSRGIRNLHHTVELGQEHLLGVDVQRHATHITLMHRTNDLDHHRIAHTLGKGHDLVLIVTHKLRHGGNASS